MPGRVKSNSVASKDVNRQAGNFAKKRAKLFLMPSRGQEIAAFDLHRASGIASGAAGEHGVRATIGWQAPPQQVT